MQRLLAVPAAAMTTARPGLALGAVLMLAGCASLPANAPTAGQVSHSLKTGSIGGTPYRLVDIDSRLAIVPAPSNRLAFLQLEALAGSGEQRRTDLIRPGDTLTISIYEVGVSLFTGAQVTGAESGPTANAQRIVVQVRDDGTIDLPYIGAMKVEGTYPETLASAIKGRLRRLSESPEAMVAITDSVESAAYVSGLVTRSGRYRLSSARERLLDVLALAGGSSIDVDDAELRIVRGERIASVPLGDLRPEDLANITVTPGDRIQVIKRRRTYTVFGATDHVSQVPFEAQGLSLAEAIAKVGGPSDARADARAVYLFRFERGEKGDPVPVIYRLNLIEPQSYFAAQLFPMQDKDVLLFANSGANLPTKFISVINQLFSPIVTARFLTK